MTVLSERFTQAVDYARIAHASQKRKGGEGVPYFYHLLGTASIAVQYGGDEDQCIAALLHDTIEDCGEEHEARIRTQFGDRVADIVVACSDSTAEQKANGTTPRALPVGAHNWVNRKWAYLDRINGEPLHARFVCACDKLHNVRAIIDDMEKLIGVGRPATEVFDRFTGKHHTMAYYNSLRKRLGSLPNGLDDALHRSVVRLYELGGGTMANDLDDI